MKYLNYALLLILTGILFISCSKNNNVNQTASDKVYSLPPIDTTNAVTGDWVIQRELADPQRLNPITVQDAIGQELSYYIFERLLWAADRTTYETLPWMAEAQPLISDNQLE